MEYKYFTPDSSATSEELKKQYKKLVLKYHVDRLGNKKVSKEEYLRREKTMSEINVEYALLRKTFFTPHRTNHEAVIKGLEKIQADITRILKEIPDETKNEMRSKAVRFLRARWQEKLEPLLPDPFREIAGTFINEKITGFDPERELNKLDVEKLMTRFISRKK